MKNERQGDKKISRLLILLFAGACGLIVANLYYAQPLVGPISMATGIPSGASGLVVTMTQLGYAAGLLFLVPLSDLLENRKLIVSVLVIAVIGLAGASAAKNPAMYFAAAVLIGLGSVAAQILVPFAAHLSPAEQRGKTVGNVMSGLLLGIMLARPASGLIADLLGWQAVFVISSALMVMLIILLSCLLPKRNPEPGDNYPAIIKSLWHILITTPIVRRRSLYQAALFGSFSLFWTVVPLWLAEHFHLNQKEIALFAFVGVGGAVAAPIAGRLADRGFTRKLTGIAFVAAAAAFAATHLFQGSQALALPIFCAAAICLDMSVSGNLVLGQQAIYTLGDEIRGRVNGLFMAIFFGGGAIGSALGGWSYAQGKWAEASLIGFCMPVLAFLYYLTDKKGTKAGE